jgi:hypothetical protein
MASNMMELDLEFGSSILQNTPCYPYAIDTDRTTPLIQNQHDEEERKWSPIVNDMQNHILPLPSDVKLRGDSNIIYMDIEPDPDPEMMCHLDFNEPKKWFLEEPVPILKKNKKKKNKKSVEPKVIHTQCPSRSMKQILDAFNSSLITERTIKKHIMRLSRKTRVHMISNTHCWFRHKFILIHNIVVCNLATNRKYLYVNFATLWLNATNMSLSGLTITMFSLRTNVLVSKKFPKNPRNPFIIRIKPFVNPPVRKNIAHPYVLKIQSEVSSRSYWFPFFVIWGPMSPHHPLRNVFRSLKQ